MNQLGLLLVFVASAFGGELDNAWETFTLLNAKVYTDPTEFALRKGIFINNHRRIAEHNSRFENGEVDYSLKMNRFGDLTDEEFEATVLSSIPVNATGRSPDEIEVDDDLPPEAPKAIDWREKGAVSKIKNQGQCGSCWAFATTSTIESHQYIKNQKMVLLSEQNLMDCSNANKACQGGTMQEAYKYIAKNGGIDTESSYPYEGVKKECRFDEKNIGAKISGHKDISPGDEATLTKAVAKGPVAVGIDATGDFRYYHQGIYNPRKCDSQRLNHAIVVVGYGESDKGEKFYIIKNSWGEVWGDKGFGQFARDANNKCGIATMACYPKVTV